MRFIIKEMKYLINKNLTFILYYTVTTLYNMRTAHTVSLWLVASRWTQWSTYFYIVIRKMMIVTGFAVLIPERRKAIGKTH